MKQRVLIVDDQREVSRLLRSALETIEQGLDVTEAPSGEEAMLEASRSKIDLLIADYRLPGITGIELMKKIRARQPQAGVILVTGVSDPRARAEIDQSGADASFIKPVPMSEFLAAVERVLGLTPTIVENPSAAPAAQPEERSSLSDLLIDLRQSLQARAVMLLNDRGQVLAEAGELPDPSARVSVIAALLGLYSAAQKVASILGRAEHHLHLFDSESMDAIFLPVGQTQAVLVMGEKLADLIRLPQTLEKLDFTRRAALQILQKMGEEEAPAPQPPAPAGISAALEAPTIPAEFDDLFRQAAAPREDANAFWDALVENGTRFTQPDKLTYEQAAQLGLAPKDGEK
ncbi:MAG: hypothetical protein Fur0035_17200 [Anaerolineales bacterium]